MGIFGSVLGIGNESPAGAASPYLNKIPGMLHETFDPYINQGKEAYGQINPIYGSMAQDPMAYLQQLMQGYQPSQGYQQRRDEALTAAGNTAAAGGMRGSFQDIKGQGRLADSLLTDDMQQWLKNVMGVQNNGLQGLGQFYNNGYDASKNLAGDLSNVFGTQGQLAFQDQSQKNRNAQNQFSGLGSLAGGLLGFGAGGLPGAFVGTQIGQSLF